MIAHSSVLLWRDIHEIADQVCENYGMRYGKILPETRKQAWWYGETFPCDRCESNPNVKRENCNEKSLYLRLHQLHNPDKPLSRNTIIRTLAHELAHLREWNHGPAHKEFEAEIIRFIKDLGYTL